MYWFRKKLMVFMGMVCISAGMLCRQSGPFTEETFAQETDTAAVDYSADWAGIRLTVPESYFWEDENLRFVLCDEEGSLLMEVFGMINESGMTDEEYSLSLEEAEETVVRPIFEQGFEIQRCHRMTLAGHPALGVELQGTYENGYRGWEYRVFVNNENAGQELVLSIVTNLDNPYEGFHGDVEEILGTALDPLQQEEAGMVLEAHWLPEFVLAAREEGAQGTSDSDVPSYVLRPSVSPRDYRKTSFSMGTMNFEIPSCLVPGEKSDVNGWVGFVVPDSRVFLDFCLFSWEGTPDTFRGMAGELARQAAIAYQGEKSFFETPCNMNGVPGYEYLIMNAYSGNEQYPYQISMRCLYNQAADQIVTILYGDRYDEPMDYHDIYLSVAESVELNNAALPVNTAAVTPAFQERMDGYRNTAAAFTQYLSSLETGLDIQLDAQYQLLSAQLSAALEELNQEDIYALSTADRGYYDATRQMVLAADEYRAGAVIGGAVGSLSEPAGNIAGTLSGELLSELFGDELGNILGEGVGNLAEDALQGIGDSINDEDGVEKIQEFFESFLH